MCVIVAFTSCSKNNVGGTGDSSTKKVSIDPIIETRATELSFENNDMVGLSINMNENNSVFTENALMTYNGSNFVGDLTWYSEVTETSTLLAYYPYISGSTLPTSFTVNENQTEEDAYTISDLMIATKTGVTPTVAATLMTFKHALSRIVVDLNNLSGKDIQSVVVCGTYSSANIDLWNKVIEVDESSSTIDISVPLWSDGTYKAIIVPQNVALTFVITYSDGSVVSMDKSEVSFVGGSQYTAEVLLTAEGGIDVTLSGDIEDWTDGGFIPDAESTDDGSKL